MHASYRTNTVEKMHPHEPSKANHASEVEHSPASFGLTKICYSVNDTLSILSISRTTFYALIKSGDLKLVKVGQKSLVYARDIAGFLRGLEAKQNAVPPVAA
jgi:excisionase family DNA binding protein